ncbi:MAG: hypothetical protein QOH55_1265, partial [Microbacteriaceae bacterium]|nr:hypothetical protein [Microbacteriaceae bacterium]
RKTLVAEVPPGPVPDLTGDQGGAGIQDAADLSKCAKRAEQPIMIELLDKTDLGRYRGRRRPHRIERCGERVYEKGHKTSLAGSNIVLSVSHESWDKSDRRDPVEEEASPREQRQQRVRRERRVPRVPREQ